MRILKGWTKKEQKELEDAKKFMKCNYLLYNITSNRENIECGSIKDKYDAADTDERISIIRDILDFYTDKATFIVPKKYYVHFIKSDESSYLNLDFGERPVVGNNSELMGLKTKFTREEVVAINPKFVSFMEEEEDDE